MPQRRVLWFGGLSDWCVDRVEQNVALVRLHVTVQRTAHHIATGMHSCMAHVWIPVQDASRLQDSSAGTSVHSSGCEAPLRNRWAITPQHIEQFRISYLFFKTSAPTISLNFHFTHGSCDTCSAEPVVARMGLGALPLMGRALFWRPKSTMLTQKR